MSDTPETDAAWKEGNAIREWTCRKLERERDGLKYLLQQISRGNNRLYEINKYLLIELIASRNERDEAREKLRMANIEHMLAINKLCNERDEAREERDNLKQELEIVTARLHGKKHPLDNGIPERHEVYIFKQGKYELDT